MAKNCFVEKEPAGYQFLRNTSGDEVVAGEFCIIGGFAAIAQETIAANAWGNFLTGSGALVQSAKLTTSDDTFGTPGAYVYWNDTTKSFSDTLQVGYYKVGQLNTAKVDGVIAFNKFERAEIVPSDVATIEELVETIEELVNANAELGGRSFMKKAVLSSTDAATPVHLLTDEDVGEGKKAYVSKIYFSVDGGTAWATTENVTLQDTAETVGLTVDADGLTANAMFDEGGEKVMLAAPIADGAGFTEGKGLDIAGNANGTAGSDLIVTVFGCIM